MAEQAAESVLERARALFDEGGADALRAEMDAPGGALWLEAVAAEPDEADVPAAAVHYELLAYDALARERFGWACVCLSAATVRYADLGRGEDEAHARTRDARVRRECFPPFEDEAERLRVVRSWARARSDEMAARARGAEAPDLGDEALGLRLGWMLRQTANAERGRALPLDHFTSAFALEPVDALVLLVLAAVGGEPTVGGVVDLLAEREDDRGVLAGSFDSRGPLRRFGLVHVPGDGAAALRQCPVAVDEAVMAAADGRDAWPGTLDDVARLHGAVEGPPSRRHVRSVAELEFLTGREDVQAVALRGASASDTREIVRAWAASALRPWVELRAQAGPFGRATWRALARELRLRGAVLFVQADRRWTEVPSAADVLADLTEAAALAGTTALFDAPVEGDGVLDRHVRGLAELTLAGLSPEASALAWNEALEGRGLEPLPASELAEALGHLPLGAADIAHLVHVAALRAGLQAAPGRAPTVTVKQLQRLATRATGG